MKPSLYPEYYKEFSCIGPACEDSCCYGWQISIDKRTYFKYKNEALLREHVVKQDKESDRSYGKIVLDSNNQCPLLTDCGLCGVHQNYGEEYLSETCSVYPRSAKEIENVVERSLDTSCPEAARLILLNKKGISFEYEDQYEAERWDYQNHKYEHPLLWELRVPIIQILQNQNASIEIRLIVVGLFLSKLQNKTVNQQKQLIDKYTSLYHEYLSTPSFISQLERTEKKEQLYLELGLSLLQVWHDKGFSTEYSKIVREAMNGLKLNDSHVTKETINHYRKMKASFYDSYMEEKEYVLENYLVNYVFLNLVPINKKDYKTSYIQLVANFLFLKLHIIGNSAYHQKLTDRQIIRTVYSYSRQVEHNVSFIEKVVEEMKKQHITSMGHLTTMLLS